MNYYTNLLNYAAAAAANNGYEYGDAYAEYLDIDTEDGEGGDGEDDQQKDDKKEMGVDTEAIQDKANAAAKKKVEAEAIKEKTEQATNQMRAQVKANKKAEEKKENEDKVKQEQDMNGGDKDP